MASNEDFKIKNGLQVGDNITVLGTASIGSSSLVESWMEVGQSVAAGSSRGAIYLYGAPTGYSVGGTISFYTAADHDTNNTFYRTKTSSEDLVFELANGNDILTYDYSASQWSMPQSGGLGVTGDITAANLTATNDLAVGQNDNTLGQVYIYGNGTGNTNGGELRLYTAADYDTNTDYYLHRIFQEDYYLQDQGFNTLLTYDHSAGQWSMPQSGGLSVTGDITAANITSNDAIYIGQDDTTLGSLFIYGPGTGTNGGGEIYLYTSADNDTNVDRYQIRAFGEDFQIQQDGNVKMRFDYGTDSWYMFTNYLELGINDTQRGELRIWGAGTGSSSGGALRLYTAADHDTNTNYYQIRAVNEDFYIEGSNSIDIIRYDYSVGAWYMGQADNTKGSLWLFGDGAASANGGELRLYNAADHDTNVNYYSLYAESEDFLISYGTTDFLQYDYSASQWLMPQSGGLNVTGNITVGGTVDGRDIATDGTKLDGIEAGATADQTASEILTALLTVDGTGSGLDADLWDGNQFASYLDQTLLTTSSPSFTNITSTDDIYIGQNDTAFGQLFIYGNGTGSSAGGEMYLYTAADHDTNTDYYRIRVLAEDLYFSDSTGATLMRHDHSAGTWWMPTTRLIVGTNDTTYGDLYLYGNGTGSNQGGMIRLFNAADHDTTNEGYNIKAWNDSLTFEKQDGTDLFVYNNADNSFRFPAGNLYVGTGAGTVIKGSLYLFGEATGGTAGGELFLYNSIDHQSSPNPNRYHFRTISGDFYITGNSTYLQYDVSADQWIMPASGGLDVTGDITVGGTVDGRDIATNIPASLGTAGQVLTVNGTATATEWTTISGGVTIADDTTTNSDAFYVTLSNQTTGSEDTLTVSSTKMYFNPSTGQLNATNFNSLSDIKYKENVRTISDPTSKVMQLRGVNFNWIEDKRESMGVIAQEIEKVIPEVVSTGEDKTVNYSAMIGLLIEAIKEQQREIDNLKSRL